MGLCYLHVMARHERLYQHILLRRSDANVSFSELCQLMKHLGFNERVKGDHHIFSQPGIEEILNLQPRGSDAKPYQVKQVRDIVLKFGLRLED